MTDLAVGRCFALDVTALKFTVWLTATGYEVTYSRRCNRTYNY